MNEEFWGVWKTVGDLLMLFGFWPLEPCLAKL